MKGGDAMRAVFIIYQRLKIGDTKEIYQYTKEFHQPTNESHQITNEFHQYTKEIHRYTYEIYLITKEIQRNTNEFYLTNEQHLTTNERYCTTNDGITHMMTATLINSALLSAMHECGLCPPSGPMADPMAMPNPFGEQNRPRAKRSGTNLFCERSPQGGRPGSAFSLLAVVRILPCGLRVPYYRMPL